MLAGCVLECRLAYRRSIAVLPKLYNINRNLMHPLSLLKCCPRYLTSIERNPMHPLSGALPLPYVTACVTRGVAKSLSTTGPCCLSTFLRNHHNGLVFDGVD